MDRPGAARNCISRHRESPRARSRRRGCVIQAIVYGTFAPLSKLPSSKPTRNIPRRIFRCRNAGRIIEVSIACWIARARAHVGLQTLALSLTRSLTKFFRVLTSLLPARVARVYGFRVAATLRMVNPHTACLPRDITHIPMARRLS